MGPRQEEERLLREQAPYPELALVVGDDGELGAGGRVLAVSDADRTRERQAVAGEKGRQRVLREGRRAERASKRASDGKDNRAAGRCNLVRDCV